MITLTGAVTNSAAYPTGSSYYVTATSSASLHTKGSYAELTSATGFDADGLVWHLQFARQGGGSFLSDLATGAAASETIIIPNFAQANGDFWASGDGMLHYPLPIAASTRLSARVQGSGSAVGSDSNVWIYAADGLIDTITAIKEYGSTGSTGTTLIDPGGTANTKGAYTQLTASTSAASRALVFRPLSNNTFPQAGWWKLDIATGAAASETVVLADLPLFTDIDDRMNPAQHEVGIAIAASTRVSARAQCSNNDGSDRVFGGQIIVYEGSGAAASGGGGSFTFVG